MAQELSKEVMVREIIEFYEHKNGSVTDAEKAELSRQPLEEIRRRHQYVEHLYEHLHTVQNTILGIEAIQAKRAASAKLEHQRDLEDFEWYREQEVEKDAVAAAQRKAQEPQDRKDFAKLARQHGLSECRANVTLWLSTHSIDGMAKATRTELDAYGQELIEKENVRLLGLGPVQLRQEARAAGLQSRIQGQQNEADEVLEAQRERDSRTIFPVLPENWQGQKLDAAFIKSCSAETQRLITRRFGAYQVQALLNKA